MSEEKPKSIEGEIFGPDENAQPATGKNAQSGIRALPLLAELYAYADRRVMEAETKLKRAVADNINAQSEIAQASENWAKAEERIQPENLDLMKKTVRTQIQTDRERHELELSQVKSARELQDLEHEAKKAELEARIASAQYQAKKHKDKLNQKEKSLDDLIKEAEAELKDLQDTFADKVDVAKANGERLREDEEDEFSRKYQELRERLDELNDRRRQQQQEDES